MSAQTAGAFAPPASRILRYGQLPADRTHKDALAARAEGGRHPARPRYARANGRRSEEPARDDQQVEKRPAKTLQGGLHEGADFPTLCGRALKNFPGKHSPFPVTINLGVT